MIASRTFGCGASSLTRNQADAEDLIKPKAHVVLKQAGTGSPALTEELMALCRTTLAPYKYPRWIEYVTDLPKTATGKIQRFRLRNAEL